MSFPFRIIRHVAKSRRDRTYQPGASALGNNPKTINARNYVGQSLSKIILHLVFSTTNREKCIPENSLKELHAYIAGICREMRCEAFRVGGMRDHIHIACTLSRTITVSDLLRHIKGGSSQWVHNNTSSSKFSWQSGYGAFSIGESQLEALIAYIENQQSHHKSQSYREELIHFLDKYNVDHDEEHLWE